MGIKFENVSYREKLVDVTFDIKFGQINTIVGSTGSGKSIIVQLICMLKSPTKGRIIIDDSYKIGLVNQQVEEQFFCQTVRKELESNLEGENYTEERLQKRIKDSLKMVGLEEKCLERDPLKLSSSEMRKLSLAKALSINPKILILDEPSVGLDNEDKKKLVKIIKTLKRRFSKTIIIITQDVEFAHLVSDYIIGINKGRIVAQGDKYTFFKQVNLLKKNKIGVPKIIEFEDIALKTKKIKLGYRDDVNDLIKDIMRNLK